jgi:hypothetical protein
MSPRSIAELYANVVSSFANTVITATRLTNNMIFGNMEAFKTSIQQAKYNTKELSRIGVNTASHLNKHQTRTQDETAGQILCVEIQKDIENLYSGFLQEYLGLS